jgi:hypothetical protein
MKFEAKSIVRKLLKEELGQTLPFTAVILVSLMGLSGMAVDAGHGYYAYERLKVATNAATLAGAAGMPNTTTAQSNVTTYSSAVATDKNFLGTIMSNVVTTTTFSCSSTVSSKLGVGCETAGGGTGGYNALTVKQTAKVNTWFGALFGISQFNIAASSMAAMAGGTNLPYNIAVILDTTASMNDADDEASCTSPKITCALGGLATMLQSMDPCALSDTSCSSSSNYVDDVSLFVFPAVTASTVGKDYDCSSSTPTSTAYTFPNTSPAYTAGSAPATNLIIPSSTGTYQVINFSNNYKTTDGATTLNSSSSLAKAAGYSGCSGVAAPGGQGTYYAQAIYAAQAALTAQASGVPGAQNIMIILSDGDANASNSLANNSGGAGGSRSNGNQIVATTGTLNGTCTTTSNCTNSQATVVTYPSALGQCGQAVQAAQYATSQGTMVYTIGMDSPTSGCATDVKYSATVGAQSTFINTKYAGTSAAWTVNDSPCNAIGAMASNTTMFYSDYTKGCPALTTANGGYSSLAAIFKAIVVGLTSPRLIPPGTT